MTEPDRDDRLAMADALERRRQAESREAAVLIAQFARDAAAAGVRAEVLTARSYNGQSRVRTQVTGWYLKRDRSVGVGTDGLFYVLSTPVGLRERLRGATLSPADPPLELGRGARDGESLPLVEALRKRLDAGSDWR
ncbi:hypothetical protein Lsed01_01538 [Demequina sediminis]|uniref:HK97 gp10 family phage protein n=1 Tax=Demequina sediminis TaxID=1930058 RepID=A0ABP9WGZ8_9MICO|nr:hypothetical protein [Demequina sediminis]BDZ60321.1 hypothetical protein GCM10025873_01120 [Demequina sediminis]